MSSSEPHIVSVNVGRPRTVHSGKLEVSSAIWKFPVAGRVAVNRLNFAGDQQADLKAHGGPDKALYAYATEDLEWWAHELNTPVEVGAVGENLTTSGIMDLKGTIGERWSVGTAVLEVAQPRIPCYKLGIRFEDPEMPSDSQPLTDPAPTCG